MVDTSVGIILLADITMWGITMVLMGIPIPITLLILITSSM